MTRRLIDLPEMIVRDVAALRGQSGNMIWVTPEELSRIVEDRVAEITELLTDDMLRVAVKVMEEPDRIQGFSSPRDRNRNTWGPPHWVVDYGQRPARELWRGDSHDEMMERCEMERLRIGLRAALTGKTP